MAVRLPPRVIHVVVSLDHGGLEKLVVNWTNARNERFPESTLICCLDRPGDLAGEVVGDAVLCVDADRSKFPMDLAAVRRIRSWVRGLPGVVVHSHNLAAQQYSAAAVWRTAAKHIHTEHGTNPHFGGIKNYVRTWLMLKVTDRIVAVSEDTATELDRNQKILRSKLLVIRNGVSPRKERHPRQSCELRADLGIDDRSFVIGSIGRLAHVKGYDRLLKAFSKFIAKHGGTCPRASVVTEARDAPERARSTWRDAGSASAVLLLVGDGPEREALEDQAGVLDIEKRVIFAGYRQNATELLNAIDLFVLPSRSEGLSVALLEAMSAGVPVLVTDVGENADVLNGGECGMILPSDETAWPDLIAGQLSTAIGESEEAEKRVQRAKERVAAHYSQTATMDAYEREYLALIDE